MGGEDCLDSDERLTFGSDDGQTYSIKKSFRISTMGRRGMLVFKGDKPKKKKSKKIKHSTKNEEKQEAVTTTSSERASLPTPAGTPLAVASSQEARASSSSVSVPSVKPGSGKITTSGAVVTGHGTKFERELSQGDAMIVEIDGQQEMRVVKMRLSGTSCGISSAYSVNLSLPTPYSIIRKPRDERKEARLRSQEKLVSEQEAEKQAQGTFAGNNTLVYRERTEHGSYRIQKVGLEQSLSRGELLSMRTKKTSDKYC